MASNTSRTTQTTTQTTTRTPTTNQFGPTTAIMDSLSTSIGNLFDCNVTATQAALDRASTATAKLFAAKTPLDILLLGAAQAQANFEAITTYWRELASITLSEQSALGDVAQSQYDTGNKAVTTAAEGIGRILPNGLDNLFGMTNAAFDNASKLYGQWADASEKALNAMQFDLPGSTTTKKQAIQQKRANGQSHATA